jgi:hypothetical protein
VELVARGLTEARQEHCDVVIAIGGGSVIDTGKAIAGLLTSPGDVMAYLEVVGEGKQLRHPAAPFIAVPTTAGTGSEVTRNAVLGVPGGIKVSLRSPFLLPRLAVVDPQLTLGLPPKVTGPCVPRRSICQRGTVMGCSQRNQPEQPIPSILSGKCSLLLRDPHEVPVDQSPQTVANYDDLLVPEILPIAGVYHIQHIA